MIKYRESIAQNVWDTLSEIMWAYSFELTHIITLAVYIPFCIALYVKFRWSRRGFNFQTDVGYDYIQILNRKLPRAVGPSEYLGLLSSHDLISTESFDIMILRAIVESNPVQFQSFPTKRLEFPVAISKGKIPNRIFDSDTADTNKVLFYIPGTAFSVANPRIESSIASHLSFIHNCRVVLLHHALAPQSKWPHQINDVCRSIGTYCLQYHPSHLMISGYSIGGLLAVLSAMILPEFGIKIDRLILFAPALDMTNEMNYLKREALSQIRPALPNYFVNGNGPVEFVKLQRLALSDRYYNPKPSSSTSTQTVEHRPFQQIVVTAFSEEQALHLQQLRKISPCWFNQALFKHFPETTIIIGERDYFRVGVSIFYQKLVDAGCKANQIVISNIPLKSAHFIIWQSLIPLYLSQHPYTTVIGQSNSPDALYTAIKVDNERIRVPADGKQLELNPEGRKYADNLKENCAKLTFWGARNNGAAQSNRNRNLPGYEFSPNMLSEIDRVTASP